MLPLGRNFEHPRLTPAIVRAADILDHLAAVRAPVGVASIARELGIPRNTAYEVVKTLASRRLVHLDGEGRVTLGLRLFELGNVFAQSLDLLTEARPIVEDVVRQCNETTHLAILEGRHVVYLIKQESTRPVRVLSVVGGRIPAHATAVGKAILAFMPRDEALQRLSAGPLERLTPSTITDLDLLVLHLDQAVQRRYSTDDEESSPEVCCVAAPVRDRTGSVVGGISIAAPRSRTSTGRREELAWLVIHAAETLSRRLGYIEATAAPRLSTSGVLAGVGMEADQ